MIRAALLSLAIAAGVLIFGDLRADPHCYLCANSTADWVFVAAKGPGL